jgi:hypothetical protein
LFQVIVVSSHGAEARYMWMVRGGEAVDDCRYTFRMAL